MKTKTRRWVSAKRAGATGMLAALLLAACAQPPPPTPIVVVVTVITNASPVPPTITPVPTETTQSPPTPTESPTTPPTLSPFPTITVRPQRPTRTPVVIIPIVSPTSPPPITEWRGEYFNNLSLIGQPVVLRNDRDVDFDWLTGSPDPRVNLDLFSARWSRSLLFEAGNYRFRFRVDDGVRLFVDGVLVLDDWRDGVRDASVDLTLARGNHSIRVEYYERGGRANIQMSIARLIILPSATPAPTAPPPPPTRTPTAIPQPTSTPLPTQPPPPPPFTRTPTSIPDDTSTPIPPTPIPSTPTPTRPNPTATPLPPTPTLTPIPADTATTAPTAIPSPTLTAIPAATDTPQPPTATPLPTHTATPTVEPTTTEAASPTPIPEASNTPLPTRTGTATPASVPVVTASLIGAQLQVTGTQWSTRVSIAISAKADGSSATSLGNVRVNRRGVFTFTRALIGPIPNPLYVVVRERRVTVIVPVTIVAPEPEVTPTVTLIP